MFSYEFFHPYHVVPSAKLVAAFMEGAHHAIAQLFMKAHTVLSQVLVLYLRVAYTGIYISYALFL